MPLGSSSIRVRCPKEIRDSSAKLNFSALLCYATRAFDLLSDTLAKEEVFLTIIKQCLFNISCRGFYRHDLCFIYSFSGLEP